ncbi:DUF3325 domain-containing protein [Methylophaga sp.]|uniref:DUF3325 domain-containing protein n=1 Tax=Methylophaga sp. TaxID=2024840 RepID=UPI003F699B3E
MIEALCLIAAAIAALAGMGWLALTSQTHRKHVFPVELQHVAVRRQKMLGWSFLLLSAVFCFQADHPSMAVLVWVMFQAFAAMMVAMVLSRRPVMLRLLCPPLVADKILMRRTARQSS